jgi:hypothetical protein
MANLDDLVLSDMHLGAAPSLFTKSRAYCDVQKYTITTFSASSVSTQLLVHAPAHEAAFVGCDNCEDGDLSPPRKRPRIATQLVQQDGEISTTDNLFHKRLEPAMSLRSRAISFWAALSDCSSFCHTTQHGRCASEALFDELE